MGIVRFGPLVLRWCLNCNIPVVEQDTCELCKSQTVEVPVTPPGDIKPAFPREIRMFRKIVDAQFGEGCGRALFPQKKIVVLNPVPSVDKMYEVILDGQVVGAVRYDFNKKWQMILRMEGAFRIEKTLTRNYVVADEGAIVPVLNGSNLMAVGVVDACPEVAPGNEVLVLDKDKHVFASGVAKMSAAEMLAARNAEERKGVAVKVRWREAWRAPRVLPDRYSTWDKIAEGSAGALDKKESMAINFIQNVIKKYNKPVAVSFSGGKDSLVTLMLVLKAGVNPKIFFIDTGLEFPETREYVHAIAKKFGVEVLSESAGEAFWENVSTFGPPGRDFRWCCKVCKLAPTSRLISKNFPEGVLVFIGQRVYESEQRAQKGNVWENPWVPGQIGASPVQYWNALHVWLYIFREGLDINPWYLEGLERIGCYLCPAGTMGDFSIVRKKFAGMKKWERYLQKYCEEHKLPEEYVKYGLWRWRSLPAGIKDFLGAVLQIPAKYPETLKLDLAEGYSPCTGGISIEGVYNAQLDIERIANLLNIVGTVKLYRDAGFCETQNIKIFAQGAVIVKGKDTQELREHLSRLHAVVMKSVYCVKCGICVARCPRNAISFDEKGIRIDEGVCKHCGSCLQPCPAIAYKVEQDVW